MFEISNTSSSNSGPKPDADIWQSPICVQKNKENPALCTAVRAVYFLAWVRSSWDLRISSVTTEQQRFENCTRPWASSSTNNYKRRVQIFKEKEEGNQLSASLKKIKRKNMQMIYRLPVYLRKKSQQPRAYETNCEREWKLKFPPSRGCSIFFRRDGLCRPSQRHWRTACPNPSPQPITLSSTTRCFFTRQTHPKLSQWALKLLSPHPGDCDFYHTQRKAKSKPFQQPQLFRPTVLAVQHFSKKFAAPHQIP